MPSSSLRVWDKQDPLLPVAEKDKLLQKKKTQRHIINNDGTEHVKAMCIVENSRVFTIKSRIFLSRK